jgi:hypothetical protein
MSSFGQGVLLKTPGYSCSVSQNALSQININATQGEWCFMHQGEVLINNGDGGSPNHVISGAAACTGTVTIKVIHRDRHWARGGITTNTVKGYCDIANRAVAHRKCNIPGVACRNSITYWTCAKYAATATARGNIHFITYINRAAKIVFNRVSIAD